MEKGRKMKIKPVDNVYFGAHLPKKQNDEGPISHNGRMVDKSRIVDGLCEIKNVLEHARKGRANLFSHDFTRKDYLYFEEVIEAAKDYLLED